MALEIGLYQNTALNNKNSYVITILNVYLLIIVIFILRLLYQTNFMLSLRKVHTIIISESCVLCSGIITFVFLWP